MSAVDKDRVTFVLVSHVDQVDEAVRRAASRALNRIAIDWHALARQATPVDTGRLRASLAFTTPTVHALHTERFPGNTETGAPGGVISYLPPEPDDLRTEVGSNVEYALEVHETHPTMSGFISDPAVERNGVWQGWLEDELRAIGGTE